MVYCINDSLGFASSGIEYAQVYRAKIFRTLGIPVKFIFTGLMPEENIRSYSENIGFKDEEIIWLYGFFTDIPIKPYQVKVADMASGLSADSIYCTENADRIRYGYKGGGYAEIRYIYRQQEKYVKTIEYGYNDTPVKLVHYTACAAFSEALSVDKKGKKTVVKRSFFNQDGSTAYEEIVRDGHRSVYLFPDRRLESLNALVGYLLSLLQLSDKDTIILDRDRDNAYTRALIEHKGKARLGTVLHAEHSFSDEEQSEIVWNKNYLYRFRWNQYFDFFAASTQLQADILRDELRSVYAAEPEIHVIPVGSIDRLHPPAKNRKAFSLITASRLAPEKHLDIVIPAVIGAHAVLPELTLDIYGKGVERSALQAMVTAAKADAYIHFKGQQKLDDLYAGYDAYISGSYSEGFGLTLLEACSSGLPLIGFDVRYGNKEFISDGRNGVLAPFSSDDNKAENIRALTNAIIRLFCCESVEDMRSRSYKKAKDYLTEEIERKWKKCLFPV